jgi:hypothetical protein
MPMVPFGANGADGADDDEGAFTVRSNSTGARSVFRLGRTFFVTPAKAGVQSFFESAGFPLSRE